MRRTPTTPLVLGTIAALTGLAAPAAPIAAAGPIGNEFFLIDFEGIAESTPISTQYAPIGVTFEIEGDPAQFPIIAVEGNPRVAFAGNGSDRDMSSGIAGLTDPEVDDDHLVPFDIRMNFDPPANDVRFFVIDIDQAPVTITAFDAGGAVIESITKDPADEDTGNNTSTEILFAHDDIVSILVDVAEEAPVDFAIDFITFTRPCVSGDCPEGIELAQESAPGAGDFDTNVLGTVFAYPTTISPIQFFAYDVPEGDSWNGATLSPEADRSHMLLSTGPADLSVFVVHDRAIPNDPDGGRAEMIFRVENDANGAFVSVRDDPFGTEAGAGVVEISPQEVRAGWSWNQCCTDGLALSGIDDSATVFISFDEIDGNDNTAPIQGMVDWVFYSADGAQIPLALEVGRRVRLRVPSTATCLADITGDGSVDFQDLLALLAAWGSCP